MARRTNVVRFSSAAALHRLYKEREAARMAPIATGDPAPRSRPLKAPKDRYCLATLFRQERLPEPVLEFQFHPLRKWRFDYALVGERIAIEIEGGVYTEGRHLRPLGYLNDLRKYRAAVLLGWRLLRYAPSDIGEAVGDVRLLLAGELKT